MICIPTSIFQHKKIQSKIGHGLDHKKSYQVKYAHKFIYEVNTFWEVHQDFQKSH